MRTPVCMKIALLLIALFPTISLGSNSHYHVYLKCKEKVNKNWPKVIVGGSGHSPLIALSLDFSKSEVTDLSLLASLPLKEVILSNGKFTDLAPLSKLKTLKHLSLKNTRVTDLSPLSETSLESLNITNSPIQTLKTLTCKTIIRLSVTDSELNTIEGIERLPLKTLGLYGTKVKDLAPLSHSKLTSFSCTRGLVVDFSPLSTLKLEGLYLNDSLVGRIDFLKGTTAELIDLSNTTVLDLSPLADNKHVKMLRLTSTKVTDLSPLKNTAITQLSLGYTKVSDLSPIQGLPLFSLDIHATAVRDVSPLEKSSVYSLLFCPYQITKGLDLIRSSASLKQLSAGPESKEDKRRFTIFSREEFWKKFDAGDFK